MASIFTRPLDLIIVLVLACFFVIGLTIDYTQTTYGSVLAEEDIEFGVWPPAPVLRAYAWWCETVDTLLAHNPSWYSTMAAFSTFLYCPFYLVAIYAFVCEKEWIRIPALLWGWGIIYSMIVIVHEQLYGPYPTKNITLFVAAYGGYVLMPLMVMARVARTPLFNMTTKQTSSSAGTKSKKRKTN